MDELGIEGIHVEKTLPVAFTPLGVMVTPGEVADRLSKNLYAALSDGSDDTVRFGIPYDLDDKIIREVVLIHTIYELHIALGHEEAGKEYRIKAKDIILAAWGDFPDSDSPPEKSAAAAVAVPPKRKGTWR